jgi:hypothetical membrane protein
MIKNKFNLNKYLLLAGILGPIIFYLTIYLIFPLFYPGYDMLNQTISELGFYDSPIRTITNVFGFSLFGIFIMIFGYGLFRSKELDIEGKIAGVFIFISGIMLYLVGVFPGDIQGNLTSRGLLHIFFANYPFVPMTIAFLTIAVGTIRQKNSNG